MKNKIILLLLTIITINAEAQVNFTRNGKVTFFSKASVENIEAINNEVSSFFNAKNGEFVFVVLIKSFKFQKALMEEHFNENYLESAIYPKATYTGKLIDKLELSQEGKFTARSKGWLNIHGVAQERISKSVFVLKDKKLIMTSNFNILLQEYNINIPIIVHQKIAEEIDAFNRACQVECNKKDVLFIDITSEYRMNSMKHEYLVSDQMHPSEKEYSQWCLHLCQAIRQVIN